MSARTLSLPTWKAIVQAQMLFVISKLRRETAAVGLVMVALALCAAAGVMGNNPLTAEPSLLVAAFPLAILLPISVWRSEHLFDRSFLWTLPAKRQWNLTARIAAGAVWLIAAMLVTLLVLAMIAWSTGGQLGLTEYRLVAEPQQAHSASRIYWQTRWWEHLAPFTAAIILYLFATSILIGLKHPMRWVMAAVLALSISTMLLLQLGPEGPVGDAVLTPLELFYGGRFTLDYALTGGSTSLAFELDRAGASPLTVWRSLPTFQGWAEATLLWSIVAMAAVGTALRRHAE